MKIKFPILALCFINTACVSSLTSNNASGLEGVARDALYRRVLENIVAFDDGDSSLFYVIDDKFSSETSMEISPEASFALAYKVPDVTSENVLYSLDNIPSLNLSAKAYAKHNVGFSIDKSKKMQLEARYIFSCAVGSNDDEGEPSDNNSDCKMAHEIVLDHVQTIAKTSKGKDRALTAKLSKPSCANLRDYCVTHTEGLVQYARNILGLPSNSDNEKDFSDKETKKIKKSVNRIKNALSLIANEMPIEANNDKEQKDKK